MQDYLFAEANRVPRNALSPVSGLEKWRERVIEFLLFFSWCAFILFILYMKSFLFLIILHSISELEVNSCTSLHLLINSINC